MSLKKIHLTRQSQDNTLVRSKLVSDFLEGSDLNLTNGSNNATITGLKSPINDHDVVIKSYVDGLIDPVLKSPDDWDASVGTYPTEYKEAVVSNGDTFLITAAGTMGTTVVNVGDFLVAKSDAPGQVDANWFVLESNRDQATETIKGVAKIATDGQVAAGTDDETIVTPVKLATAISNIVGPAWKKELFTLTDADINTNGYINLTETPFENSTILMLNGLVQYEGATFQYTISEKQVTLVTPSDWSVGDVVLVQYQYQPAE